MRTEDGMRDIIPRHPRREARILRRNARRTAAVAEDGGTPHDWDLRYVAHFAPSASEGLAECEITARRSHWRLT